METPTPIKIYVSRNGQSMQLKLRDSEGNNPGNDKLTTHVKPNDIVEWHLDPDELDIASIISVNKKVPGDPSYDPNSVDLLVKDPTPSDGVFSGTVKSISPGIGKFEDYKIGFKIQLDGPTYYDDPKLQIDA